MADNAFQRDAFQDDAFQEPSGVPSDTAPAEHATGTGSAFNATIAIGAYAGLAAGTGTAHGANAYEDEGTDAIVTLAVAEVIATTDPNAVVTLAAAEVIFHAQADLRVTLMGVEVIYLPAPLKDTGEAWIVG